MTNVGNSKEGMDVAQTIRAMFARMPGDKAVQVTIDHYHFVASTIAIRNREEIEAVLRGKPIHLPPIKTTS